MPIPALSYTKDWTNPADFPTFEGDETKVRQDMQLLYNEVRDFLNGMIEDLASIGAGKGASCIGVFPITGVGGSDIQGALESLKTLVDDATTGSIPDGSLTGVKLADLAIITAKIADLAITSAKLADGSVTAEKIADGAVSAAKISTGAVGGGQIADGAVSSDKLVSGAVTEAKLGAAAVTAGKLANLAVITSKIAELAVTTAKIANLAVTEGKLANGAVTEGKLANGSVTEGKLANGAVSSGKIASGSITPEKLDRAYAPISGGTFTGPVAHGGNATFNRQIILSSYDYGTTLPTAGTAGRLFFKKV